MKVILITFDPGHIAHLALQRTLNDTPRVRNWQSLYLGCIVVVIQAWDTASAMADFLRSIYPTTHFIVTELDAAKVDGSLPSHVWEFIRVPTDTGRWKV